MVDLNLTSPEELKRRVGDRKLYVWGASIVGLGTCRSLERNGFALSGFIDSSPRFHGRTALGYPVFPPAIVEDAKREELFVVIASGHYGHEISKSCRDAGLIEEEDFVSASEISPLDPSVDISGVCNLHCISCPRGNDPKQPPPGFMKPDMYRKVLEKLLFELPFVGNIQLYAWGEPFLNPDVAEIIRMTVEKHVMCAISTNLNLRKDFGEAIRAKPDWIKLSVSGYGPDYEKTHTGGKWDLLYDNMKKLSNLRRKYHPLMQVEVNYHLYKHNTGEPYRRMEELCGKLDFAFKPNYAYLYPLDNILAYREGRGLSKESLQTLEMLLLPIDEGIAKAEAQKGLECAEERCFPINWDGRVRFCGAYFHPVIEEDFLGTPLSEIIRKRNDSAFCRKCKSYALHRFTGVYVEEQAADGGPDKPGES